MKSANPKQQIDSLGAGIFVRTRNVESRLADQDFHRAFTEPVIVWFTPGNYDEAKVELLLDAARNLYAIHCFRFPNVKVPLRILDRIRSEFPDALLEGVRKI